MASTIDWSSYAPQANAEGESSLGLEAERMETELGRPLTVPEYDKLRDRLFRGALESALVPEAEDEDADPDVLRGLIHETLTENPGWTGDQIKTQVRRRLLLGGV